MRYQLCFLMTLLIVSLPQTVADDQGEKRLKVDKDKLHQHVAFLTRIEGYRHHTNYKGLEQSAHYIQTAFATSQGRTSTQAFEVNGHTYQNIICRMGPEKGPRIVIGAHYDVAGMQPGADDNASAVAGLIELVRMMDLQRGQLNYGLEAVAYCLEEPPFFYTDHMGSRHHAKALRRQTVQVKEMICLEMIGYFSDADKSQKYPLPIMRWFYPDAGNFIGVVSNLKNWSLVQQAKKDMRAGSDLDVQTLNAPTFLFGVHLSDHSSYWKYGYPALMITDTAFNRNPNYHQPSDTIETLNFDKMAQVVRAVAFHILEQQKR